MSDPPAEGSVRTVSEARWVVSPGIAAGAAVALLLAVIGLIAGRVDVTLLCLPLVAVVALSRDRLPRTGAPAAVTVSLTDIGASAIGFTVNAQAQPEAEAIVLRHSVLGGEAREVVVAGPLAGDLSGTVALGHSGPQELVRVDCRLLAAGGAASSRPLEPVVVERVVAPGQTRIRSLPLPRRLHGMTGPHESARIGDGGEFRDIHLFSPGDRLRRIDWRATARRGQSAGDLYVRRTNALADATVLIVMDSRDDVGEQVREWSRNVATEKGVSSLDIAREAASSIAAAYIAAGDRVGFQDLSSRARMVAHAGGARHLWRLLRVIEVTAPSDVPFRHRRPPIVPPGALVYLLSSLLDDQSLNFALTWLGNGHRVIAVDVLPPARFARTTRAERLAHRMVLMERDDRIRLMRMRGVEVLRWSDDRPGPSLTARLELLARPVRRRGSTGARR